MSSQDFLNPKLSVGRTRPQSLQFDPGRKLSPTTPSARALSGIYGSSAAASFRSDEEHLIFEFGSRFLRAGFAGESKPRCTRAFGPDEQRRVGDFRRWMPGYESVRRKRKRGQDWGEEYELWKMDLRNADLGLVEDKIERAVREIIAQYLLLDHRPRRATVAVPAQLPRPLMSALLSSVFTTLQAISITVLSVPVLNIVSAGLRSGLVVDLGWSETTVTAVYEYREIHHRTSVRAGKYLTEEMAKVLNEECHRSKKDPPPEVQEEITFEEAEEVLTRMAWCLNREEAKRKKSGADQDSSADEANNPSITVPFPSAGPPMTISVPFNRFAEPSENALFASNCSAHDIDDHDLPIPLLAYNALLSIPIDARKLCMPRIIVTGGASKLPGVKRRILAELEHLVKKRGWDPVRSYGSATQKREELKMRSHHVRSSTIDTLAPLPLQPSGESSIAESTGQQEEDEDHSAQQTPGSQTPTSQRASSRSSGIATPFPASELPQEIDPITAKLQELGLKQRQPGPEGIVRGVETLGAWAGASIVAQMRIRGIVEVDKDRFMQHGLAGATKDTGHTTVVEQKRQSTLGSGGRAAGDRGSWTLGVWA
ncbi:actin-related protein ro7 [Diplodia corticola]|uniref:Actin-related protein ro7 n=1 Tax=Diplodia corticola TaxID=236234 RepID=A0A1J9R3P6_9PEZI|nr:actin-related protein ro7 [Diplodia corticola]OJD34834.1 actin-related protein ro7 [Diplodia corticola]